MFEVLDKKCTPTKGSKYSACIDLYAREDVVVGAGETVKVPLGVCINLDEVFKVFFNTHKTFDEAIEDVTYNKSRQQPYELRQSFDFELKKHYLQLEPRSSLRAKGLTALGSGIIDLDYKDENYDYFT